MKHKKIVCYPIGISLIEADATHRSIRLYMKKCLLLVIALFLFTGCAFFREAIKEKPFNAKESFEEANNLMKDGFNEKAREIFETVLAKDVSLKYSTLSRVRIGDTYFEEIGRASCRERV